MKQAESRKSKWLWLIALLALWLAAVAIGASAQNPILEFSFDKDAVAVPLEGSAMALLRVENTSVYEADDIEIMLLSGPIDLSPVEPIEVLSAFSDTRMTVIFSPGMDAVEGETAAVFGLLYTYCVDDLCFQIMEEIVLSLTVVPAIADPVDGQLVEPPVEVPVAIEPSRPNLVLPILVGLGLVAALIAGQLWGRRWWVTLLLIAVLAVGMGVGIASKQDQQAQSIGAVLCTSCVGIEVTPHEEPELSDDAQQRIAAIDGEIELLLFTATWCHACPYAKAMAYQAAEVNPSITIQIIDVDVDKDAADYYGIVQSGRTIVPAILRVDTGELLLGIEDLEERLVALLEESS